MTKKTRKTKKMDAPAPAPETWTPQSVVKSPILYIMVTLMTTSGLDINASKQIEAALESQSSSIVETNLAIGGLEGQLHAITAEIVDNSDRIHEHEQEIRGQSEGITELRFDIQELSHVVDGLATEVEALDDEIGELHEP